MKANIVAPLLPLAIPINDCHPDPTNARTGHAIDRIAASLRQYGQRKPIVVNSSEGGKIEAGNGTWQAAKRLGWTHIAAVSLEDSHVDAIGYGLSDNRTGDMSGWDAEMLAILAESLPPEVYTGFEGDELNEILAELGAGLDAGNGGGQGDAEPLVDRAEELRQKWGTEVGQLWQIGEHRLIVGDCTDRAVVERVMGGERAELTLTDPPYGIDVVPNSGEIGWSTKQANVSKFNKVINDDKLMDVSFLLDTARKVAIFGGQYFAHYLPRAGRWLVWDKDFTDAERDFVPFSECELVWSNIPGVSVKKYKCRSMGYSRTGETGGRQHPNQKPVIVITGILKDFSQDGEIVLDPFAGSGTTLVACQNLNRRARAIEISPAYCGVILQRMRDAFPDIDIHLLERE